ncbi:MAG: hypothetical protein ACPLPR_04710 [Bacillota bacterium]
MKSGSERKNSEAVYEREKTKYLPLESYWVPRWYVRYFVWVWPAVVIWVIIAFLFQSHAPSNHLLANLLWGGFVVALGILGYAIEKAWPI